MKKQEKVMTLDDHINIVMVLINRKYKRDYCKKHKIPWKVIPKISKEANLKGREQIPLVIMKKKDRQAKYKKKK